MRISYYPRCTLKSNAKNFEDSAIASMRELGIEMEELPRWNCCGTVFSLASDDLIHHLAPIRVLLRAREQGHTAVVTLCAMCYYTLKLSNIRVKENPQDLEKLNNLMYEESIPYDGGALVYHLLTFLKEEVGFEKLTQRVTVDLSGLKVSPYYGCLLLRPEEVSINPCMENPTIMSDFIRVLGAVPIDSPHSTECCGGYITVTEKELVADRSYEILESARSAGADVLIASCPLCQFNLDDRQREISRTRPDFEPMPVLYFTQLLALAFGLDDTALRFDLNWVNPATVLGAHLRE